jgi:hypothetical protein
MITLLTMGAGNVKVLKETFKSASTVCNEIVYGDMLLFEEDRELLHSYKDEFNLKIVPLKFNFIFKNGFSECLNVLAGRATNDMVMYLNTSEIIEEDYGIAEKIKANQDCNTFEFIHKFDPHHWFRLYNRKELKWSGLIHEQLKGDYRPYHKPIFCMADLPKDSNNEFKAKVFDTMKEIVYFQQYVNIVDHPELMGETDPGWFHFAKNDYDSFKQRLSAKEDAYKAVLNSDLKGLMNYFYNSPEFKSLAFESSLAIEYQQDEKFLGKK